MNDCWVIKYAPNSIQQMVLKNELKDLFQSYIDNRTINNMTLYGIPGIRKSTLAKLISKKLNCDNVLFQCCSIDGSIDMVKSKINDFCQLVSKPGQLKLVILDEADSLTSATNNAGAQMALRNIIAEAMEDTRFILTCNYIDRIIPALQSRCTPIKLDFSIKDVACHVVKILQKENVTFTKESLDIFIKQVIKKRFPDIRSIIQQLQIRCQSGTLQNINISEVVEDQVIDFIVNSKNSKDIRQFLIQNQDKFSSDYVTLAGKLFDYYVNVNTDIALCIADYIYKMSIVLDKQIQFFAMIIQIKSSF